MTKILLQIIWTIAILCKVINSNELNILDLLNENSAKYQNAMINYRIFQLNNQFASEFIFRLNQTNGILTKNHQNNFNFINWIFLFRSKFHSISVRARKYRNLIDFIHNGKITTFYSLKLFDGNWHKIVFYFMPGSVRMGIDCSPIEIIKMLRNPTETILYPQLNVHIDSSTYITVLGDADLPVQLDVEFEKMIIYDKLSGIHDLVCDDLKALNNRNRLNALKKPNDEIVDGPDLDVRHFYEPEKSNCKISQTLIGGHQVCEGQLIFEENFNSLKLNNLKWEKEIRIPLDSNDAEFVSYQDFPENCFINSSVLHLVPTLLSKRPEFDEDSIRMGELNLGSKCTVQIDVDMECKRKATNFRILPPIVAAKIRTKNSFSFQYGTIEVKAKLPKGDWIFPQIQLEPLQSFYGSGNYKSGKMKIAFVHSNEILIDKLMTPIDGSRLYGGVILQTGELYRKLWLQSTKQSKHLSEDFHIYSMVWTNESIAFAIDGQEYGRINGGFQMLSQISHANLWQKGGFMAPFDKEFYISLGVGVGGVADFPDGCQNGIRRKLKSWSNTSPKAELKFWQDHTNWERTWNADDIGLKVDYVKVWAL